MTHKSIIEFFQWLILENCAWDLAAAERKNALIYNLSL